MSRRGLASLLFVVPVLCALLACSGGGGNAGADKNAAVTRDRIAEWGKFVGLDPANAEKALSQAGLTDLVGGNAVLNETEAKAFLELTFAVDKTFSQGVEEMNRRNQTAFLSFNAAKFATGSVASAIPTVPPAARTPPASGGFFADEFNRVLGLRQTALDDYVKMTEQSLTLRQRILAGAAILGFLLEPASPNELFADLGFVKLREDFAAPVVFAIFVKKINPDLDKEGKPVLDDTVASLEQVQFAAQPLANLSFRVDNRFLSFYSFNNLAAPGTEVQGEITAQILVPGQDPAPAPPPDVNRGGFSVISAEQNPYIFNLFKPTEDIKK